MGYFSTSFSNLHDLIMLLVKKMFYYDILFRSQTSIGYSISRLFKHASIVEFGSVILAIVSLFKRPVMDSWASHGSTDGRWPGNLTVLSLGCLLPTPLQVASWWSTDPASSALETRRCID
ncbi:hypothetical protein OUZ56_021059 [Daphnia magna]|uniref:Uncharacterized protein n=1 Tax=Daphnia magna TaxID=35525 RepID=A0ABQ9ZGA4_9CRUS|nr:hypothetical protein OUZ56_021059 [Daphnia magna]